MAELLWLVPAFPFAGFAVLILLGRRFSERFTALVGVGSVAVSALCAIVVYAGPIRFPYRQTLWTWMQVSTFKPEFALYLDVLSMIMVLVITVVGFLILLYSAEYMAGEEGYNRFFAYMDLFVGFMLTLVLADNLLLLYLGWEGVGICSYLLIGFWYKDAANGRAAIKAFVVTRFGDTAMAIGLFLLFINLGSLQIQELMQRAVQEWPVGSTVAVAAAALLLGGALGKSAQLPLQVWLPDAMAGPTPVSALIHAATMVTAGVYLIARTNVLFTLAPVVQSAVAVIGVLTLLAAGFSALTQTDIKRVLAYSTISQIGYMFLGLGVGAWWAAIFHFVTHAFFKSLLFLSAGVAIAACHHEQSIFKMGGLRTQMPVVFWTFVIGAASLASVPLVTSGFYSKEAILWQVWSSEWSGGWLWAGGLLGALLTGIYAFRVVFLAFMGEAKAPVTYRPGNLVYIPLIILSVISVAGGLLGSMQPLLAARVPAIGFSDAPPVPYDGTTELIVETVAAAAGLIGISLAYLFFLRRRDFADRLVTKPVPAALHRWWFVGWGFDWTYDKLFVQPFVWLAKANKDDVIDLVYQGIALVSSVLHELLSSAQTGKIRGYAAGIAIGTVITIAIVVFL
ncbi:MAG: NADH-quinone oxidoreductase subunit L [Desulfomonile tiedjei]|nr:NADH-quinone oxidoreductase subunit L [Desulfomonile tiedjei]